MIAMAGGGFDIKNSKPVQHVVDETGKLWFMRKIGAVAQLGERRVRNA